MAKKKETLDDLYCALFNAIAALVGHPQRINCPTDIKHPAKNHKFYWDENPVACWECLEALSGVKKEEMLSLSDSFLKEQIDILHEIIVDKKYGFGFGQNGIQLTLKDQQFYAETRIKYHLYRSIYYYDIDYKRNNEEIKLDCAIRALLLIDAELIVFNSQNQEVIGWELMKASIIKDIIKIGSLGS